MGFRELSKERKLKPTTYGVGFIGIGKYRTKIGGIRTEASKAWSNMFTRCYNESELKRNPTYKGVSICEEWHNFQNFADWYYKNKPNNNVKYHLDKDILVKGNKVYSPETCCFVPHFINSFLTKSNSKRGDLPIGVSKHKQGFQSSASNGIGGNIYLGKYSTPELAFEAYKIYKEGIIYSWTLEYFDAKLITRKVYNALINYKVEITD